MSNKIGNYLTGAKSRVNRKPLYKRRRAYFLIMVALGFFGVQELIPVPEKDSYSDSLARIENYIAQKNPRISIEELHRLALNIKKYAPYLQIPDSITIDSEPVNKEMFLTAVIYTESHFVRYARSPVGAMGYMQLMPETAAWLASLKGIRGIKQKVWTPEVNIHLGVYFINVLVKEMGSLRTALLAYNAGPGAVRSWGGVPAYWNNIVAYYREMKSQKPAEVMPELVALE